MAVGAYRAMSPDLRVDLHAWEDANLDGSTVGTSDWPGWVDLIGPPPILKPLTIKPKPPALQAKIRKQVFERDHYRCLERESWRDLTIDHVIPRSRGGTDDLGNLQTLCRTCNSRKGTR